MASNKSKFSERQLGLESRVDCGALSPKARYKLIHRTVSFSLANSTSHNLGAFGIAGTVVGAYASNRTVGSYTTATIKLRNNTQSLDITSTLDPSTVATGGASSSFTLSASQPSNTATDQLVLVAAGTFTSQPVEMQIVILIDPTEDSVISD